jgi:nucleoside-diphosphate-sugar epimerase
MRILVTGGAGYLGSALTPVLLEAGHHVRVLDALLFGGEGLLGVFGHPRFELAKGDVRSDPDVSGALEDVDAVVHLAALVGEPACAADPAVTREVNLGAVERILRLCGERRVGRFVFASTCSNYGITDTSTIADERTPLHPISLYAETKVEAERRVLDRSDRQVAATVLRFATIFGLSPRPRFDLLVNELVRDAVCGREVMVYGPQAWRPFVHVADAARAILAVIGASERSVAGEVFNVGVGNYRKGELAEIVAEMVPEARVTAAPGRQDPRDYRVAFERIRDRIGFRAERDVRSGVREMATALRAGVISDPFGPRHRNA